MKLACRQQPRLCVIMTCEHVYHTCLRVYSQEKLTPQLDSWSVTKPEKKKTVTDQSICHQLRS